MLDFFKRLFSFSKEEMLPDSPIKFGVNTEWFAIKTEDQETVVDILNLTKPQLANWKLGLEKAHSKGFFISPPVQGWIFVFPCGFIFAGKVMETKALLNQFSKHFEEVYYFDNHETGDTYAWMSAQNGSLTRLFFFEFESGKWINEGNLTDIEITLGLQRTIEALENDQYYDAEPQGLNITEIDVELVLTIAEQWSINPYTIDHIKTVNGLGVLGKRKK